MEQYWNFDCESLQKNKIRKLLAFLAGMPHHEPPLKPFKALQVLDMNLHCFTKHFPFLDSIEKIESFSNSNRRQKRKKKLPGLGKSVRDV